MQLHIVINYLRYVDEEDKITFKFKPHDGQILTLFLLLGFDENSIPSKI